MNSNLNSKSTLSLRAIESMAMKASVLSEMRSQRQAAAPSLPEKQNSRPRSTSRPAQPARPLPQIERDIRAIFRSLSSSPDEDTIVVTSQSGSGLSAKWTADVYLAADLEAEVGYCPQQRLITNRGALPKRLKAAPVVTYVFYPDTFRTDRLGSVAVYGEGASARKSEIDRAGNLFGHRVSSTSLEMGRRLFVDVRFA